MPVSVEVPPLCNIYLYIISIWVFPKIGGYPPKSSILIGISIIFTIHFGVPLFLETPISRCISLFFYVYLFLIFDVIDGLTWFYLCLGP